MRVKFDPSLEVAVALSRVLEAAPAGSATVCDVTYTDLTASNHRLQPRRRTRLRSSKIIDPQGRFLHDCLVHDQSTTGARLRLQATETVPSCFAVFDDREGTIANVRVVWRRGSDLGVRFVTAPQPAGTSRLRALGQAFYAVAG